MDKAVGAKNYIIFRGRHKWMTPNSVHSYIFQIFKYKQNIEKHHGTDVIICPYEITFLQFVDGNTDHDIATVHWKKYATWDWFHCYWK